MTIEEIVIYSLQEYTDNDIDELYDFFENNEDIEIAYELWENTSCRDMNLVDIESEIRYLRTTRKYEVVK